MAKGTQGKEMNFKLLLEKAREGDPMAQADIGLMYLRGKGVKYDVYAARKWLSKARKNISKEYMDVVNELLIYISRIEIGDQSRRITPDRRGFRCTTCGLCCGIGDAIEISFDRRDIRRWSREYRADILNKTIKVHKDIYEGWFSERTGEQLKKCPWSRRGRCRIHDTKPQLCQLFPFDAIQAMKVGCPGYKFKLFEYDKTLTCPWCSKELELDENYFNTTGHLLECGCGAECKINLDKDKAQSLPNEVKLYPGEPDEFLVKIVNIGKACLETEEGDLDQDILGVWIKEAGR